MRCYWCDNDSFMGVMESGELIDIKELIDKGLTPKDHACKWCGHLVSEPNPRAGDPEETLEAVKEERDEVRAQLEQCLGERVERPTEA